MQEFGTRISLAPSRMKLYFIGSEIAHISSEKELTENIPRGLEVVPQTLCSTSGEDVGLFLSAEPVVIKTKGGLPPSMRQYPIANEAIPSISNQTDSFLKKGILKEYEGPYNTPILPVNKHQLDKDGDAEYRFVQDLRAVNEHVVSLHHIVPDPNLILTQIPAWARYYTVLDLTGAFFSIPITEESQVIFAFTWQGKQLTWMQLPQGFTSSPTIFSQILKKDLRDLSFPGNSVLVQYVDDLLLASHTQQECMKDTEYLYIQLGRKGHRASLSKLQLCLQQVKYSGIHIET